MVEILLEEVHHQFAGHKGEPKEHCHISVED